MVITTDTRWDEILPVSTRKIERRKRSAPMHVAVLTPFDEKGLEINWEAFHTICKRVHDAEGAIVACADTGFNRQTSPEQKVESVRRIRSWFPATTIIGAVSVNDKFGDRFDQRGYAELARDMGPYCDRFMFMQSWGLMQLSGDAWVEAIGSLTEHYPDSIVHELVREFAPFARACTPYEFHHVIRLPNVSAGKLSELVGDGYQRRHTMIEDLKSETRKEFELESGNDWDIEEGLKNGLLMGAACLEPHLFAHAMLLWREGRVREFTILTRALQFLSTMVFRPADGGGPLYVGCYRHSIMCWLQVRGFLDLCMTNIPFGCPELDRRDARAERDLCSQVLKYLTIILDGLGIKLDRPGVTGE